MSQALTISAHILAQKNGVNAVCGLALWTHTIHTSLYLWTNNSWWLTNPYFTVTSTLYGNWFSRVDHGYRCSISVTLWVRSNEPAHFTSSWFENPLEASCVEHACVAYIYLNNNSSNANATMSDQQLMSMYIWENSNKGEFNNVEIRQMHIPYVLAYNTYHNIFAFVSIPIPQCISRDFVFCFL